MHVTLVMFFSVMRSFNVNFDVNFDNFNELFYIGCPYALYYVAEKIEIFAVDEKGMMLIS